MSNTKKKRLTVSKAEPFNPTRLWGDEKYSLQNMLMRQVRFPAYFHEGDLFSEWWSDHAYKTFQAACEKYRGRVGPNAGSFEGGDFLSALSEDDFVEFCREAIGAEHPATGARVVRHTNASSGYPVYSIQVFAVGEGNPDVPVYSSQDAPNVNWPQRLEWGGFDIRYGPPEFMQPPRRRKRASGDSVGS